VIERAAREDAADRRLPGVPVRVDETRHDNHSRCVDLFRLGHSEATSDLDDRAVLDDDIAHRDVADVGIHRDDEAVPDQKPLRGHASFLLAVSGCRMYSEHKRPGVDASTRLTRSGGRFCHARPMRSRRSLKRGCTPAFDHS